MKEHMVVIQRLEKPSSVISIMIFISATKDFAEKAWQKPSFLTFINTIRLIKSRSLVT